MFKQLICANPYLLSALGGVGEADLKRWSYPAPTEKPFDPYVLPIKQDFIKDARLMPGTRLMLALLSGWAGKGTSIETTLGIIGKHLGRCTKQISRYIDDAIKFGYMTKQYTKDKIGYITGLKLNLVFELIRPKQLKKQGQGNRAYPRTRQNPSKAQSFQARTYKSNTNGNYNYILDHKVSDELKKMGEEILRSENR